MMSILNRKCRTEQSNIIFFNNIIFSIFYLVLLQSMPIYIYLGCFYKSKLMGLNEIWHIFWKFILSYWPTFAFNSFFHFSLQIYICSHTLLSPFVSSCSLLIIILACTFSLSFLARSWFPLLPPHLVCSRFLFLSLISTLKEKQILVENL